MTITPEPTRLRPDRPAPLPAQVRHIARLAPRLMRITFGGGALETFTWPGPASHLKVIFRPEEAGNGAQVHEGALDLADRSNLVIRTYTPRRFDPVHHEVDIDFVVHGHGPASNWATTTSPGEHVALSVPRATYRVDPTAKWLLVAGDESAMPAIGTILDAGVSVPTAVFIEADGPEIKSVALAEHRLDPFLNITWVSPDPEGPPGEALAEALRGWKRPSEEGRAWVACEAVAVRHVRRYLLEERGFSPAEVVTRGYWRIGEANHPDHDHGDDAA
jgi:NADPH-dependent ferric siderophore reductase